MKFNTKLTRYITILKLLVHKILYYILTLLNLIVPKSSNKIFIFDKRFKRDNVWAISQYLCSNDEYDTYEIFYYTRAGMQSKHNLIVVSNKFHALWLQLRSNYVFYAYEDIKKFKPVRGQIIVNTMHGSPIKNIGYLSVDDKMKNWYEFHKGFTYILCVSDLFKKIIQTAYGVSEEKTVVLGYPRNDYIYLDKPVLYKLGIRKDRFKKNILWMPTWRGHKKTKQNYESDKDFPILNSKNIEYIQSFLSENEILLIIKPHPNQLDLDIFERSYKNILIIKDGDLNEKDIFLYQIFHEVDALVTDYSSVYFDFLLTMKPIGFTIDDIESYKEKRGFVVDNPLDLMPGHKIKTTDELLLFFNDIKNNKDKYYEERERVNDLVNKHKDGNSTKRLMEFLDIV